MSAVSTTGLVLSLLGLTSLAGAGIAVGSGVSMVRFLSCSFGFDGENADRMGMIAFQIQESFQDCFKELGHDLSHLLV